MRRAEALWALRELDAVFVANLPWTDLGFLESTVDSKPVSAQLSLLPLISTYRHVNMCCFGCFFVGLLELELKLKVCLPRFE